MSDVLSYLNLVFLAELPIGVLYLQDIWGPLTSGLYLALYGILSRFSSPDNLASRLAVFDSIFTVMGKNDIALFLELQGDHSGCDKPLVDIKTKVPF